METHFSLPDSSSSLRARQRILEDLRILANDAESLVRSTVHDASETAQDVRSRLTSLVEKLRSTYDTLKSEGLATVEAADEAVRANPYKTVAIAFGVGVLVGAFVKRK